MSEAELKKASLPYFGKGVEALFATSDGQFFLTEKAAKQHKRGEKPVKILKPTKSKK